MDPKTVLSFFRLKDAPWFQVVGSAFALLVIGSWLFKLDSPSDCIAWILATAGIPAQRTISAVHGWFVEPARNSVVLGVLWVSLASFSIGYAHSAFCIDQAQAGLRDKRQYRDARQRDLFDKDNNFHVSEAERKGMLERAEADLQSEITYWLKVRTYYLRRMARLAAAAWVAVALALEAGGFTWPWLLGLGVGSVIALFVGLAAAGLFRSFLERLQETGGYLLVAGLTAGLTAVSLVLFLFGLVINQPVPRDGQGDPESA